MLCFWVSFFKCFGEVSKEPRASPFVPECLPPNWSDVARRAAAPSERVDATATHRATTAAAASRSPRPTRADHAACTGDEAPAAAIAHAAVARATAAVAVAANAATSIRPAAAAAHLGLLARCGGVVPAGGGGGVRRLVAAARARVAGAAALDSNTYGCSRSHLRLQSPPHTVAACTAYGCRCGCSTPRRCVSGSMRALTTRRSLGRARRRTNQSSNPNPDPDPSPSPNPNPNPSPNPNQAHQSDLFGLALVRRYTTPPRPPTPHTHTHPNANPSRTTNYLPPTTSYFGLALVRRYGGLCIACARYMHWSAWRSCGGG